MKILKVNPSYNKIIKKTNNKKPAANVKKRIFILGGGPSVRKLDLSFLKSNDVICVNESINLINNPKYFITMDYSFFTKTNSDVRDTISKAKKSIFVINKKSSIEKINNQYIDTRLNIVYKGLEHFDLIIESNLRVHDKTGFSTDVSNFTHGDNSGYCAIQFAILEGYTEIYLIGFDYKINNQQTHWHDKYKKSPNFEKKLEIFKKNLEFSLYLYKNKGVKFYTVTESAISNELLPKITFTKLQQDLIIISYYTLNTPYEQEVQNLIKSIADLNLNSDIVGINNLGSWHDNVKYKAKFILSMIKKYPEKKLLFVDADAVINKPPVLFNNYDCDIAVRWESFNKNNNLECLSGTIFIKSNRKTVLLCKRWIAYNAGKPTERTFEQINLGKVITEMRNEKIITDKNLPPEYTMIYDSMRKIYKTEPVIEHFQASRRFKNKIQ